MRDIVVFLNGAWSLSTRRRHLRRLCRVLAEKSRHVKAWLAVDCQPVGGVNTPDFVAEMEALRPDRILIAGYSSIFRDKFIAVPKRGTINLRAGCLPLFHILFDGRAEVLRWLREHKNSVLPA
jgi:hypothetical protein